MEHGDNDIPTCGKGLAEHSAIPAKLGELTDAVAANLELHMLALDLNDETSRREHDAYASLAKEHRATAARLRATASEMAGYRGLPMGRHDEQAMSDPRFGEAFGRFVQCERELLALLQRRLEQDEGMLAMMREEGGGES
jgi:hypothetical protein